MLVLFCDFFFFNAFVASFLFRYENNYVNKLFLDENYRSEFSNSFSGSWRAGVSRDMRTTHFLSLRVSLPVFCLNYNSKVCSRAHLLMLAFLNDPVTAGSICLALFSLLST